MVSGNGPSARRRVYGSDRRHVVPVPVIVRRHMQQIGRNVVFGSMNARSLSKVDELLLEFRDRSLDAMLLCETWHDSDSVLIHHRAEPSLGVNHGGVAIVAAAGIQLTAVDVGPQPTLLLLVYRLGHPHASRLSSTVQAHHLSLTAAFFTQLADVLDRLSTFVDPVVLAGDVNIRLERATDPPHCRVLRPRRQLRSRPASRGMTHDAGGTLDVDCTRDDLPPPTIDVIDIGLSDHRLLRWQSCLLRLPPVYVKTTRRSWRSFDDDTFQADLRVSGSVCTVRRSAVDWARR